MRLPHSSQSESKVPPKYLPMASLKSACSVLWHQKVIMANFLRQTSLKWVVINKFFRFGDAHFCWTFLSVHSIFPPPWEYVIRSWWWILWWLSTNWSIAAITLTSCGVTDENYLQLIRVLFRPTVFICWEADTRDMSQVVVAPFLCFFSFSFLPVWLRIELPTSVERQGV